jgi:hypothetical protein
VLVVFPLVLAAVAYAILRRRSGHADVARESAAASPHAIASQPAASSDRALVTEGAEHAG